MRIYKLSKTVLSITRNPAPFLNGLTSNALNQSQNAFLNIHGRIVATFDQITVGEDEIWIVLETSAVERVLQHLDQYIRLIGVKIKKQGWNVYFDLEGNAPFELDDRIIPQPAGRLLLTPRLLPSNVSLEDFTLFRLLNDIPWPGIDYADEFILNVSDERFVSYTKGCFLGQEPVAKVHNRSKPSWKLEVREESGCTEEEREKMTSRSVDPTSGRKLGFVFIRQTH